MGTARPPSPFVAHVCELLEAVGPIRWRRMFGGYGLYCDDLFFALIADDVLYLKTDDGNRPAFEALGLEPFRPFPDKDAVMAYHPVPDEVLDDRDALAAWANGAVGAALRARGKGRRKKAGRPRRGKGSDVAP